MNKKLIHIHIPEDLINTLDIVAKKHCITRTSMIKYILSNYIQENYTEMKGEQNNEK